MEIKELENEINKIIERNKVVELNKNGKLVGLENMYMYSYLCYSNYLFVHCKQL